MSLSNSEIPNMFYRVYRDDRIAEVIASRRIKHMYRGGSRLYQALIGHIEDAVFLAESVDDAVALSVDVCGERAASKYWRGNTGIVRACQKHLPEQFEVIHHAPRFFAIAISPEWLDTSLLKRRYNQTHERYEWLYPDEIIAPVDLEPIEIEQAITPYDALIEINSHV